MHRSLKHLARLFVLLVLVAAAGCTDDAAGPDGLDPDQQRLAEEAARHVARAVGQATDVGDMSDGFAGWAGKRPAGKYDGCPALDLAFREDAFEITADWGDGCTDEEGEWHRGMVTFVFEQTGTDDGRFTATFVGFADAEVEVDGTLVVEDGPPARHSFQSFTVTTPEDGTVTLDTELFVDYDEADPEQGAWAITGAGTVENDAGERFAYDIVEPLEGEAGCEHPMRGVLDVSIQEADGSGFDATIDYFPNDGACDDIAVITVDGYDVTTDVSS